MRRIILLILVLLPWRAQSEPRRVPNSDMSTVEAYQDLIQAFQAELEVLGAASKARDETLQSVVDDHFSGERRQQEISQKIIERLVDLEIRLKQIERTISQGCEAPEMQVLSVVEQRKDDEASPLQLERSVEEAVVQVAPKTPTAIVFPADVKGGWRSYVESLSLQKEGSQLILMWDGGHLPEKGVAHLVYLKDGRFFALRVKASPPGEAGDSIIRIK